MPTDFLPPRDADLALWTGNFAALIGAAPATYGLTTGQASTYVTTNAIWQAALATATDPTTRTQPSVAAKDAARANVSILSRQYGQIVQSTPTVTDEQIAALGLTVRSSSRTPSTPPTTFPLVAVISTMGGTLQLRLNDQNTPDRRARPFNVIGAQVWSYVGTVPPTTQSQYNLLGIATRQPSVFGLNSGDIGKTIWILARWMTRRAQVGPWSSSVSQIIAA